jgi:hypothetical protein
VPLRGMAIGLLAASPLAAAGCGGSGSNSQQKAGEKTASAPNFATSYVSTLDLGKKIQFHGSGVVDNAGRHTRVTVDLSKLAAFAGGRGNPNVFRGDEIVDTSGPAVVYLRIPFYTRRLAAGKTWLRIDYGKLVQQHGLLVNLLTLNQDPRQYLDFLLGAFGKVQKLGDEQVGGVATRRYSGKIDLLDYPMGLHGAEQTAAEHLADRVVQLTQTRFFPTEVWIDAKGYVRRMTFAYVIPPSANSRRIEYALTLEYSGFGAEAPVALPPARDVGTSPQR